MGVCIYCGQSAGFLRRKHRECEEKHHVGWEQMIQLSKNAALGESPSDGLIQQLEVLAKQSFIPTWRVREAMLAGWEQAVSYFLEDGNLDPHEEAQLVKFARDFNFTREELNKNGFHSMLIKGAVLRELMEGKCPNRFQPTGRLPFNFQKNESLIWAFDNVRYYEEKTRREYVGGSHGVSVRLAKGLYYRVGGFKGHPVEITEKVYVDTGILAVTTKHLYFHGSSKIFRIRWNKIVSFMPYSDGIGVQKDAARAKPQFFITGDGWFTYNLVTNVANLDN